MINAKTWNPAQIDQAIRRLEGIIRSGSYNPAELNQILNQLGEPGYINTWNPAELDQKLRTLLYDLLTWKTVTGNPIQLRTNNGGLVESCEVTFSPIQSGSGDPSPTNIRPISGWDSLELTRTGKNLVEITKTGSVISNGITWTVNSDGTVTANGTATTTTVFLLKQVEDYSKDLLPNTEYIISSGYGNSNVWFGLYYDDSTSWAVSVANDGEKTFKTISDFNYVRFGLRIGNGATVDNVTFKPMARLSTISDSTFEKYQGQTHTATFSDTVYGGSYEFVSGKIKSEWGYISEYDGETITEPWISSIDKYVAGTTPSTGAEVCYKLATPTEITLTPEEIELLSGDNVLWTDGDNIEIVYKKLLLPSDVESLSKVKIIEEKPKTKRSKKKKEE